MTVYIMHTYMTVYIMHTCIIKKYMEMSDIYTGSNVPLLTVFSDM